MLAVVVGNAAECESGVYDTGRDDALEEEKSTGVGVEV